ncbi:hypothetical protein [Tissierella praeacuta]|uniref:hypothetical protein n=1 Tax=Tissierella praeacuta TaxID=43131 RepID=UPI0028AAA26E|nr:hypothetical protein [Tissierella praeacuta]
MVDVNLITESFCDTDFLINLNIHNDLLFEKFYKTQECVYIADIVRDELKNLLKDLGKYGKIYDKIFSSENNKISIVCFDGFDSDVRSFMKAVITEYGMRITKDENLGEFKSALYSVCLEINVLRTCDHRFIAKVIQKSPFNNIQFVTLRETLLTIMTESETTKIEEEIKELNDDFNVEKDNKKLRKKKEDMLNFFNSKRL